LDFMASSLKVATGYGLPQQAYHFSQAYLSINLAKIQINFKTAIDTFWQKGQRLVNLNSITQKYRKVLLLRVQDIHNYRMCYSQIIKVCLNLSSKLLIELHLVIFERLLAQLKFI